MVNKLAALLELARYHAAAPEPRPRPARITYIEAATKEGERGAHAASPMTGKRPPDATQHD